MKESRRRFLAGTSALALTPVLSGCLSSDSNSSENDGKSGDGNRGSSREETVQNSDDGGSKPDSKSDCNKASKSKSDITRVGFTGDAMLGRSVNEHYSQPENEISEIWGGMLPRLKALDSLFINLECNISSRGEKWPDRTYHFRANPGWSIKALQMANVGFANLANNHMKDFGEVALTDTLKHLSDGGIKHAGAGRDKEEAFEPAFLTVDEVDIAFVSFTDNTPQYQAKSDTPGTAYINMNPNYSDTRNTVKSTLEKAKSKNPDLIFASLHWGPNWVVKPSEKYRGFAHLLIDEGVDLVHGHSAHTIQGIEIYSGQPILHDTGNFVDDYVIKLKYHNDYSFVFEAEISKSGGGPKIKRLRLDPIEIDNMKVKKGDDAADWLFPRMKKFSKELGTEVKEEKNELVVDLPMDSCN